MACYKKEHVLAKAEGMTQEKEADAVCSTLFKLLMTWCVAEGNVFVWCFSLLMWHLMARSINVDSIALHNIKKGVSDSIVFANMMRQRQISLESLCRRKIVIQTRCLAANIFACLLRLAVI